MSLPTKEERGLLGFEDSSESEDLGDDLDAAVSEPKFDDLILALQQAKMDAVEAARAEYINSLVDRAEAEMESSDGSTRSKLLKLSDQPNFPPIDPNFRSTADSWNRLRDKARVESQMRLREQGDDETLFVDPKDPSVIVGRGYRRVLYGDHGPYLEFAKHQVRWASFPRVKVKGPYSYYHEHYTKTSMVKVYEQRKTVGDKPNPPPGRWTARNNRVATGYADYQPQMVYMSCDALQVLRSTTPCWEEAGKDIDALFPKEGESLHGP